MSYQALARKYRPQSFAEVVGQQHALNSLIHALETQKVHHAYLFTGTRGVGKTTLGRLLAKCLNCKNGVTAEPCNQCENCVAINNNSFIDLIEIDAASRTGVEETKEILDNIQYMPSQGRYKVYLIDEVHMLSKQSFNALLKTLEEPPEYVKFILATTDYHKIPVTILSRCIQLHLKHISQTDIKAQLRDILAKENIQADEQSLDYIAYNAKGSLRDALSILDQAISFCGGDIKQDEVKQMLGIIDSEEVYTIINAVINNNPSEVLPAVKNLALSEGSADAVLDRIAEIWFSACVYSFTQSIESLNDINIDIISDILAKVDVEQVHFLYQLTIAAKKDISLAPNFETGVTMAILRLIAFQKKNLTNASDHEQRQAKPAISESIKQEIISRRSKPQPQPQPQPQLQETILSEHDIQVKNQDNKQNTSSSLDEKWFNLLNRIKIKGFTKTLAFNSHLVKKEDNYFHISLNDDGIKILELYPQCHIKLQQTLADYMNNSELQIVIENSSDSPKSESIDATVKSMTPAQIKRANALETVRNDKNIQLIKATLDIDIKDENITLTD